MNESPPILSLAQVPGLECLTKICEHFDVEITAFGSVVRRIAHAAVTTGESEPPNLFDLSPFLSDIDLRHSGKADQTAAIRKAILSQVPYAECFRWQVFSEADLKIFQDDEERLPVIPANKLSLATRGNRGIQDPFNGLDDLRTGRFRFLSNPFYHRSELRKQRRDCEPLHAIHYLSLVCEHGKYSSLAEYPGVATCVQFATEADKTSLLMALTESPELRSKLLYRLNTLKSVCRSQQRWNEMAEMPFWNHFWDYFRMTTPLDFSIKFGLYAPIISSCRLGGDIYRIGAPVSNFELDCESTWGALLEAHKPLNALSAHPLPKLAERQQVIGATPILQFNAGMAPCSKGDEQVHLEYLLKQGSGDLKAQHPGHDCGVLAVLSGYLKGEENKPHSYVTTLPSVCAWKTIKQDGEDRVKLQARVNFGKLLEVFPEILDRTGLGKFTSYSLQVVFVAE